jgi:signal transduction histidine kinase
MIDAETNTLNLRVADDGVGMHAQATSSLTTESRGLGLAGIRERILANQGRVQWSQAQPHGLVLDASFPLPVNNTKNSNATRLPDYD